jgi:transposase
MLINHRNVRVFLYGQPIDMRLGFERLSGLVREGLGSDLLQGHLYLFLGKNRTRAKVLLFDGTGLCLFHKRLEIGKFMSIRDLQEVKEMTSGELTLLLDGAQVKLPMSGISYLESIKNKNPTCNPEP